MSACRLTERLRERVENEPDTLAGHVRERTNRPKVDEPDKAIDHYSHACDKAAKAVKQRWYWPSSA